MQTRTASHVKQLHIKMLENHCNLVYCRMPLGKMLIFFGLVPSGEYLLVISDECSRYPEVEIIASIKTKVVIPTLDNIFSVFGIPKSLKTDNGPPWKGETIKDFAKVLGFHHQPVTPLWPQANSQHENFNRTLRKLIQTDKIEGKSWKRQLYRFLQNYSSTPIYMTQSCGAYVPGTRN